VFACNPVAFARIVMMGAPSVVVGAEITVNHEVGAGLAADHWNPTVSIAPALVKGNGVFDRPTIN